MCGRNSIGTVHYARVTHYYSDAMLRIEHMSLASNKSKIAFELTTLGDLRMDIVMWTA